MYLLLFFFSSIVFSQEQLEPIDISESRISEDLMGIATPSNPISTQTYQSQLLESERIKTTNDITQLDASVTNNYSGSGYWDSLNIRGFSVDNRSNYFRDGLRINAETAIPLENKEVVEVIKGLGAFQNSGSAPSGAVNYRVKRPQNVQDLRLEYTERGGHLTHLDYGNTDKTIKYRLNLLNEEIRSPFHFNDGNRQLFSSAFAYELSSKSLLEAEIEWSRRSQQSLSAQSFWGTNLPSVNPELNLNNQSWAKPVVFESLFYSLRYSHELNPLWYLGVSAGNQQSLTNDRMSYAFGCSNENNWTAFCEDGSFDVYDYRSENEKRTTHSARINLNGRVEGDISQELSFNLRYSHLKETLVNQAYNFVGVGDQRGRPLPPDSSKTDPSTNLDEEILEFYFVDRLKKNDWSLWLGGNYQYRYRSTWKHNGSEKNKADNHFITPWIALSRDVNNKTFYLSYSQSKESWITPNKPDYNNPSDILPEQTTHQYELGVKSQLFSSALFYLKRPRLFDDGSDFKIEGHYQQYGWENTVRFKVKNTHHHLSLMYLQVHQFAKEVNGKFAPNIPDFSLRYLGRIDLRPFTLGARIQYESKRYASYDNELMVPDWIKWDFFIEKKHKDLTLRAYVDNAFQKRFWKEAPIQYGHHYLFPGAARRVGITAEYQF
ncbi:MAG: TonB-dependent receptor plug domain-containing protein [Candidatus Caldatribacteriota bacterium]